MGHDLVDGLVLVAAVGVGCQWLAWRLRIPAIVLFLFAGLLIGPLTGLIDPQRDFGPLLRPLISLAVAVILFEGGLNLHWHEFKASAAGVKRLIGLGVPLSAVFGAFAAYFVGGLSLPVALVFAAIMVVTGPTVITPLLRQAHLNRRTASYLKWEGMINDPIGALLAILVLQYFLVRAMEAQHVAAGVVVLALGRGVLAAVVLGAGVGWLLGRVLQRDMLAEFLKAPVVFATVVAVFALANRATSEAGLLAVTLMGMVLGNTRLPTMEEMRRFQEYLTVLLVPSVFVLLTADLSPDLLSRLDWRSAALVAVMLVAVRPAAIGLATVGAGMDWRDRVLVSWIAPRGVVASAIAGVFGPALVASGRPDGALLLPLIFSMVFASVMAHGFSLRFIARRLGLTVSPHGVLLVGASPWTTALARLLHDDLGVEVLVVDTSWHRLREARLSGISVLYGELLSEQLQQSLELSSISTLFAATGNDAYNALVCHHFASDLTAARVFQLPMAAPEAHATQSLARPFRGNVAFGKEAQYEEFWRRHMQGWAFHKARLSENYRFEQLSEDWPAESWLIAVVHGSGDVVFHAPQNPLRPKAGETVIYFAPRKFRDEHAAERRRGLAEQGGRAEEERPSRRSAGDITDQQEHSGNE